MEVSYLLSIQHYIYWTRWHNGGKRILFCLFDLILYIPSTIFQLNWDRSSLVEPVLSYDKCVLIKDHKAVTPVRKRTYYH